jgi:hypothetical protein
MARVNSPPEWSDLFRLFCFGIGLKKAQHRQARQSPGGAAILNFVGDEVTRLILIPGF